MPILSVVIPTHKRPQFLSRAINSALQAAPNGDVEVIVVPNGSDKSWKTIAEMYIQEPKVQWHPIATAHANTARNHGMALANGEYIRFLDDDDFLYPHAAQEQLIQLIDRKSDLSFAKVDIIDEHFLVVKEYALPHTQDFVTAVLTPTHSTVPTSLVYKRALTRGILWDPKINKNQDVYWAMALCQKAEISSIKYEGIVGAWVQHNLPRVSQGHHPGVIARQTAEHIFKFTDSLTQQNRLHPDRAKTAAEHLWHCLHRGIMYQPFFWIRAIFKIEEIYKGCRPAIALHNWPIIKKINPLVVELAIIPYRWIKILFGHRYTV